MYGWIFRHLPGPTWLKVIEAALLIGIAVYALLEWGFPWAQDAFHLVDNTVEQP